MFQAIYNKKKLLLHYAHTPSSYFSYLEEAFYSHDINQSNQPLPQHTVKDFQQNISHENTLK